MAVEKQRPKVLIIEDDKRLLRALSYFLKQKGMDVVEATDGDAGLNAYAQAGPDIVVIDNSLPNKMGYEVCREIREGDGQETPIIMISAFMKVLGVNGEEAENTDLVDNFLRKPFQLEQLWRAISALRKNGTFVRPTNEAEEEEEVSAEVDKPESDDGRAIPLEGTCAKIPFIDLLARALESQSTGILTLREDNKVRRLYLANGFPAFARSNLITENLLRYLLRIGEIDAETYRRHLSRMQQERWRPGATLVREGAISLTRLNRSHRMLVEEILQICINWNGASFEFKPSQVPVEQAVVYDINPFRIVDRWLERHFEGPQLLDRVQPLLHGHLSAGPHLQSWRHMLEWAYSLDGDLERAVTTGGAFVDLLKVDTEHRPVRARLLQTLLMLGAVHLEDQDERLPAEPAAIIRGLMRPSQGTPGDSGVPMSFSRLPAAETEGESNHEAVARRGTDLREKPMPMLEEKEKDGSSSRSQEQLRRIYDVVLRDYRRVLDRATPYEVLRVSRNDSIDVIRRRYERFERFYRPENFQRLGDSKLYKLAIEIRQVLARAMAEIEAGGGSSSGFPSVNPDASFGRSMLSWFGETESNDPLAQIFFNDGLTFLRIADFDEAHHHFTRAVRNDRHNGMYQAYLVWATYLQADRSTEAATKAKKQLERLLDLYPEEDSVCHFLAHLHREEGNLEQAVAYYRMAAELNPGNRSARLFLQRLAGNAD